MLYAGVPAMMHHLLATSLNLRAMLYPITAFEIYLELDGGRFHGIDSEPTILFYPPSVCLLDAYTRIGCRCFIPRRPTCWPTGCKAIKGCPDAMTHLSRHYVTETRDEGALVR